MIEARLNARRCRSRSTYAAAVAVLIVLGLASRKFARLLPGLLHKNAGDILWATMVFCALGWLFPRLSTFRLAALSALFSLGIEVGKFYHAPWLDAVRATPPGRLVFGYVFSWSNLVCYLIGVGLGAGVELWRKASISRQRSP
jgi:hypothetical protein